MGDADLTATNEPFVKPNCFNLFILNKTQTWAICCCQTCACVHFQHYWGWIASALSNLWNEYHTSQKEMLKEAKIHIP